MTADELLTTFRLSGVPVLTKYSEIMHEPYQFVQLQGVTLSYWPEDDIWQIADERGGYLAKFSTAQVEYMLMRAKRAKGGKAKRGGKNA